MTSSDLESSLASRNGGKYAAVVVFIFTLLAYVSESELTDYIQTTLGYRQPYFLLYLAHSSFVLIFPLHLACIIASTGFTARALLNGLSVAVSRHFSVSTQSRSARLPPSILFAVRLSLPTICLLTVGLTLPALMWFVAITMSSVSDVTALWNTNALWCWILTVWFFKLNWEVRPLVAVLLATLGVFTVVYGGSQPSEPITDTSSPNLSSISFNPTAPVLGDLITFGASVLYGLYQVLYKKYAALSSDPEFIADGIYEFLPNEDETSPLSGSDEIVYPPPFGLHANFLTSGVGLCTMFVLWLPIPLMHYLNIERFSLPSDYWTMLAVAGMSLSGLVFNAGFMVLLGLWGPIVISVGNLLTIVLVLVADILRKGTAALTFWSLSGSGVIVAAFGILAYDMAHNDQ